MAGSKFAIMPNGNSEEIINNCGVRIRVKEKEKEDSYITYQCAKSGNKIKIGGPENGPLVIEIS